MYYVQLNLQEVSCLPITFHSYVVCQVHIYLLKLRVLFTRPLISVLHIQVNIHEAHSLSKTFKLCFNVQISRPDTKSLPKTFRKDAVRPRKSSWCSKSSHILPVMCCTSTYMYTFKSSLNSVCLKSCTHLFKLPCSSTTAIFLSNYHLEPILTGLAGLDENSPLKLTLKIKS